MVPAVAPELLLRRRVELDDTGDVRLAPVVEHQDVVVREDGRLVLADPGPGHEPRDLPRLEVEHGDGIELPEGEEGIASPEGGNTVGE